MGDLENVHGLRDDGVGHPKVVEDGIEGPPVRKLAKRRVDVMHCFLA